MDAGQISELNQDKQTNLAKWKLAETQTQEREKFFLLLFCCAALFFRSFFESQYIEAFSLSSFFS